MKTPLLIVSLLAAAAAGFAGGVYFQQSLERPASTPPASPAAVPAGRSKATTKFLILKPTVSIPGDKVDRPETNWLEVQLRTLTSQVILQRVVQQENLAQCWRTDEHTATSKLKRMIEVEVEGGTKVVSVTVFGENGENLAKLANAIRKGYEEYRVELEQQRIALLSREEEAKIKAQEAEVDHARATMTELAKKHNSRPLSSAASPARRSTPALSIQPQPNVT
jgi:hypothetical protein